MADARSAETTALESSLANLEQAKNAVAAAETQLEALLADLRVGPRAEKTNVSMAVQGSLDRLRAARLTVTDVEELLAIAAGKP